MTTDETGRAPNPGKKLGADLISSVDPFVLDVLQWQPTAALELLAEAVVIHDADGRWLYANPAAANLFGFPSVKQMLATPTPQILARFPARHEDGGPLLDEQRPGRRLLRGLSAAPVTVRVVDLETGRESWRRTTATVARDPEGVPRLAINVIEDITTIKHAELSQRFLATASETLLSTLDPEQSLTRLASSAVPALADWCVIDVLDDDGLLDSVAVAHADPATVTAARDHARRFRTSVADPGGRTFVIQSLETQVLNRVTHEFLETHIPDAQQRAFIETLGVGSVMVVPMVAGDGVLGTISLLQAESARTFSHEDRLLAEELGRRAGAAFHNARLHAERSHIAKTLQDSLLPAALPQIPGVKTATLYRPAGDENTVGGDFYDAVEGPGGWFVFIGDVTGRGVEAAALTSRARFTLRSLARVLPDACDALRELNRSLLELPEQSLCTVAALLLRTAGAETVATSMCAGHPLPLLLRGGGVTRVGRHGLLLGAFADATWTPDTMTLRRGDVLVLSTDGVTDAVGRDGRFGEDRLMAALRGATDASGAIARISASLEAYEVGPQVDDTAVVALEIL